MDKIKPVSAKKVIKALEKMEFQQIRQKGSHLFMRHPEMGGHNNCCASRRRYGERDDKKNHKRR